jgi:hypothetical protein
VPGSNWTWLPTTEAVPWPAGAEAAVTVRIAPLSTSLSLASTSIRTISFSPVEAVSGLAAGASLTPAMWKTSLPVSLPSLSVTV